MRIMVMGVCGTGKTTLAKLLSAELGCSFIEADDLHTASNRAKMASGIALTDQDRWPWLSALADAVISEAEPVVFSCSALKQNYRNFLAEHISDLKIIFLDGDPDLLQSRMDSRKDHFMPASMLDSQLATLQRPNESNNCIHINVAHTPTEQLNTVVQWLIPNREHRHRF